MIRPTFQTRVVPKHLSFQYREDGEWVTKTAEDLFSGKKVILFALPGAFTPTCSSFQLPGFEKNFAKLKKAGKLDAIYCLSVNDAFVMDAWFKDQKIKKVQHIPDGNLDWTRWADMLVSKVNLGFGLRSWRYAVVIDDMVTSQWFVEDGKKDRAEDDPYEVSSPENILEYFNS